MKKAGIFGAGQAGAMAAKWLPSEYRVACFLDNDKKKQGQKLEEIPILSLEDGLKKELDLIWIAVLNQEAADRIRQQILEAGYEGELLEISAFRRFQDVRLATLRLIAQEIRENQIPGEMAELGVFRGAFSAVMNELFPEKELHLFDTFEGFVEKDLEIEEQFGTKGMGHKDFSDTSQALVLSKMPHPEKVIMHPGYFPDTFPEKMPSLSLVSLDPDLYEPVYQGLRHFYPLLSHGGMILVHDYNSMQFPGVKKAVKRFAREQRCCLVPLMDMHGTAVIIKE